MADFFLLLLLSFYAFSSLPKSLGEISRDQFPPQFFFGVSTSSYQIEGAVVEDGRGPNTWDIFTHTPGNVKNGDNADISDDHYHLYHQDTELMHSLGINAYHFSISWTRILPSGRYGDINPKGIMFYNKLIDSLLSKGIEPFVTISHHDVPQELEDRYQSWLSPLIQDDFVYYADICFRSFGDRVKYWITINEPNLFASSAYMEGIYPPCRCSAPFGNCSAGDSEIEPLIVVHNMLLSHAKAVDLYRKRYKANQGGYLTIKPHAGMAIPYSESKADQKAAIKAIAFSGAWVLDPVILGDYPPEMRQVHGDQLPKFTAEEEKMVKGSIDFIGITHYATVYAKDCLHSTCGSDCSFIQRFLCITGYRNGIPIGEPTAYPMFFVFPRGMEMMVEYLKSRYNNMPMFFLENGYAQADAPIEQHNELLNDIKRMEYHKSYLAALQRGMRKGSDVRGYFVWSLMDNFEWESGYSLRFGIYYLDYQSLKRVPKTSVKWYRNFLTNATKIDQGTNIMINTKQDVLAPVL